MHAIIEATKLKKSYGDFVAVDGIDLQIKTGETFGILGPNGAGKTTTLEMIEGLKPITSGTVIVDDKDVTRETRAVKHVIGVQLQSSSFFRNLSLTELLVTFGALYDRTVDPYQLLEKVQLTEKAKSEVSELSGGQKQRFSIAVGLVNMPKVLFLDEPTTGLDPQARRNMWELIGQIKKEGTTIVLTTHYMEEAEVLCDRVAIMDNAKIIALGTPKELLKLAGVDATIEWHVNEGFAVERVTALPGVKAATTEDHGFQITTTDVHLTLPALFALEKELAVSFFDLRVRQATLEDVFLTLTGRTLRD